MARKPAWWVGAVLELLELLWRTLGPFGPLYVRSRRPLVASLTRLTRCSITVYCTKREMPEIGSMGARASEKEVDVDNAPTRGYQPQPVAPRRAPRCLAPVVGAKGGGLVAILNLT